jgi:Ni/Fe-hydrogenase subunit HybB-like protein
MAYLIAGLVVVSLASFVAVIVGTAMGAGTEDGFSKGLWPIVLMLPLFALP